MKKFLASLLLFSFLIVSLFACSSNDNTTAPAQAPATPLTLRADAGITEVTMDWQMVAGAETYTLYYSTSSTLTKETHEHKISGLVSAPYIVTGLITGTKYYFALSAVNANGESDLGTPIYAVPDATPPPPAPKNVRANATGKTTATVNWDTVSGADTYVIYQYNYFGGGLQVIDEVTCASSPCSYPVDSLTEDTNYIFIVTAETERGKSNEVWAKPSASSTDSGTGSPSSGSYYPQNVSVTAVGDKTVTIGWENPSSTTDHTSFNFYCNLYPSEVMQTMITQLSASAGSQEVTSLTNDTTYSFYLKAVLESSASFLVYAMPSANPPPFAPVLTGAAAGDSEVTVTWNAPIIGVATSYNIYVGTAKGVTKGTGAKTNVSATPLSAIVSTNIKNGTTYYFIVTAVNANGESTESNEWWATPSATDPHSGFIAISAH